MTTQTNIQIGRALLDGFNRHDLSQWATLLADDYAGSYPGLRTGADKQIAQMYNAVFLPAFSDLHFTMQRTVSDGDAIIYQWEATGTHDGPLALPTGTVPPTGKRVSIPGVLITIIQAGKIVREETYWNQVELLSQLGLM